MRQRHRHLVSTGAAVLGAAVAGVSLRYRRGRARADTEWTATAAEPLRDLGEVSDLRVIPLVDAEARHGLRSEHGVSYVVVADDLVILFDLGLGSGNQAALTHNADALGIDLATIDLVVVSHAHPDHSGGLRAALQRTVNIPTPILGHQRGVEVLTPVPLHHPQMRCIHTPTPRRIAPGVATTGTVARMLFFLGWTPEQALIVNVRGRGPVVLVGCGHQGIERLLTRVEHVTAAPIHGIVGGLHLPVHGLLAQDLIGTARWPWQRSTEHDVDETIAALQRRHPHLVALSPHDSSRWARDRFAKAFGRAYKPVQVGEEIHIAAA